jgi:hypothetical protein
MPAALLGELCEATAISCRPVLEAEDGLAGWRYRIPPCTAIAGRAPRPAADNSGWCWRATLRSMAAIRRCRPIVGPEDPAFAGASGPVGADLLCLQFRRRARD